MPFGKLKTMPRTETRERHGAQGTMSMAIHMRHEWGMTLCGSDGWRSHAWSSWGNEDSLKSTNERRSVTCKKCLRKLKR